MTIELYMTKSQQWNFHEYGWDADEIMDYISRDGYTYEVQEVTDEHVIIGETDYDGQLRHTIEVIVSGFRRI